MTTANETAAEFASDLRELADIIESCPALAKAIEPLTINVFRVHTKDQAASLRRLVGGFWKKVEMDSLFIMRRDMTHGKVCVDINLMRSTVCERVVVGTKKIPALVIPATEERIIEEREEEIVEWQCGQLLGDTA